VFSCRLEVPPFFQPSSAHEGFTDGVGQHFATARQAQSRAAFFEESDVQQVVFFATPEGKKRFLDAGIHAQAKRDFFLEQGGWIERFPGEERGGTCCDSAYVFGRIAHVLSAFPLECGEGARAKSQVFAPLPTRDVVEGFAPWARVV
jgi:hypothetical protein